MTESKSDLHIYARDIQAGQHNSLSLISSWIPAGARVLDLGCGSGAVGRFLQERDGPDCGPIDGLTISEDEARLAASHYRQVQVANLDDCQLTQLFEPAGYDIIICADVLEHTRDPERILQQCRQLLAAGGHVLLSIPNAAYAGLLAELMAGEFRYRKEGLLDETHLRFFTRNTLSRFLQNSVWVVEQFETITRQLPDSEFKFDFDALPPAVARHLLALPDALTYQFIVRARPARSDERLPALPPASPLPAQALFTSELYLGQQGSFAEERKLTARGQIGQQQQSIVFDLPTAPGFDALKWDPADRPGFLHLYSVHLLTADGRLLWRWDASMSDRFWRMPHDGMTALQGFWPGSPFMLLLHDDDPWFILPIAQEQLQEAAGGQLQVQLSWPMSADYLSLAGLTRQQISKARLAQHESEQKALQQQREHQQENAGLQQKIHQLKQEIHKLQQKRQNLSAQNQHLREQKNAFLTQVNQLSQERDEARQWIHEVEHSTIFRATRPIVHSKMFVDKILGIGSARPKKETPVKAQAVAPPPHPVDVIVPVYKGLQDTQRCIESVLAAPCDTAFRLIIINDASPEPEVSHWLRQIASDDTRITLLENTENLGFVATVNRGMSQSTNNDALLLNSDTEVAPGWLDRIRAAAYSDRKVASVTPFSNNATICSYPRFCADNDLPEGWDTAALDGLFARVNAGQVVDVPTGVGFCMYIRRDALDAIGLFDVDNFGKGYGEENDFCIRAAGSGWRNLHALDAFVRHYGGVSFGASKSPREQAAMQTLRRLHPRYEAQVTRFVQQDPAQLARTRVDLARLLHAPQPLILAITHDRAGGTERHVAELASLLHEQAGFLVLKPEPGKKISLSLAARNDAFKLVFTLPDDEDELLDLLRQLQVRHIHYHHLLGHGNFVMRLPRRLGASYDFTAHDFYCIDPDITLTDASGSYSPVRDMAAQDHAAPALLASDNTVNLPGWRQKNAEFLNGARNIIAPSRDCLARLIQLVPGANLQLIPHTDITPEQELPAVKAHVLAAPRPLKVAVIGALSVIKGADTLQEAALLAHKQNRPVEFHLLGYAYRQLKTQPRAQLAVYGAYDEKDLPALLDWLQPDLVWFPARWPETYSYTLSACLTGGWPVVAPNLGAFAERLQGRPWSWVKPWDFSAAQWLDFFEHIRQEHFMTGQAPQDQPTPDVIDAQGITQFFAPQTPRWYAQDYLANIPPSAGQAPADALLSRHLPEPQDALPQGLRGHALHSLTWLRGTPLLAPVARAVPQRWQTRVKTWLRK